MPRKRRQAPHLDSTWKYQTPPIRTWSIGSVCHETRGVAMGTAETLAGRMRCSLRVLDLAGRAV